MESNQEMEERLFREQQQQHLPNPPMPVKNLPPKKRAPKKQKKQTGKEPSAKPKVRSHHGSTGYRFKATTGFLTYPQIENPITPEQQLEKFMAFMKAKNHPVAQCIVALEQHKKDEKEFIQWSSF